MLHGKVLSMPGQQGFFTVLHMPELRIWQSYEYASIHRVLNMPEHALIISQYMWICLSNAEYD